MISLGLKNEQFLNDSPLEENIIGFETSQNLEWLKTETWRAVVNKFKGPHICTWLLSWRPKKADIQLYHTKLKIKNLVSCQELKGHEKAKQSYIGHGSFFVSALHMVEWSHAKDWPEEKATYRISFLRVIWSLIMIFSLNQQLCQVAWTGFSQMLAKLANCVFLSFISESTVRAYLHGTTLSHATSLRQAYDTNYFV